jgi:hypothetical protein
LTVIFLSSFSYLFGYFPLAVFVRIAAIFLQRCFTDIVPIFRDGDERRSWGVLSVPFVYHRQRQFAPIVYIELIFVFVAVYVTEELGV